MDPGYFSREISSCPKFPNIKFIMELEELSDPRSTSHVLTMAWKVVEKMRRSSGWSYFAGSFMKRRLSQSIHIIPHSRVSNWVSNKACSVLSIRRGQIMSDPQKRLDPTALVDYFAHYSIRFPDGDKWKSLHEDKITTHKSVMATAKAAARFPQLLLSLVILQ